MPAEIVYQSTSLPEASVIIPSRDGYRGGNVPRLIQQLKEQTFNNIEIIISKNEYPNGHARNVGASIASYSAKYYVLFDDDVELSNGSVLEAMLLPFKRDGSIGLTGVAQLNPPDSTFFQKWLAQDLAYGEKPAVTEDTEIFGIEVGHAGIAIPKYIWQYVGGEDDELVAGTDVDLLIRLRASGYKTVKVPVSVYHPQCKSVGDVMKTYWRHGIHHSQFRAKHPDLEGGMLFIDSYLKGLALVVFEFFVFLPHIFIVDSKCSLGFKPFKALTRLVFASGYFYGWAKKELVSSKHREQTLKIKTGN